MTRWTCHPSCLTEATEHSIIQWNLRGFQANFKELTLIIIIRMYIYHTLINALSADMIHINLNVIFYTHIKHTPTKTIYIKYYLIIIIIIKTHYKHVKQH